MESPHNLQTPVDSRTEGGVSAINESPTSIEDRDGGAVTQPTDPLSTEGHKDATIGGPQIALLARLVADVLKDSITELRDDDEKRMSQFATTFQEGLSAFREGGEKHFVELEKVTAHLKPTTVKTDPTTGFWTVYNKVADEYDNDLVSKYVGDLDTSLLFAGLFSAVTSVFIVQIIPGLQPNPVDLTNVLLLRILQQNTSFDGTDPLAPVSSIPIGVVRAQSILFASLSVTLFAAFIAVLGKRWVLYYTRVTTWGNIVDRGRERQEKFAGLQKWGLHLIMGSLPIMLQFALLLFIIALALYLWDLDISVAEVVFVVTSIGLTFYVCITVAATVWSDCPFQTPLSLLLKKVLLWAKEVTVPVRVPLGQGTTSLLLRIKRVAGHCRVIIPFGRSSRTPTGGTHIPNNADNGAFSNQYPMTLSNPTLWRRDPLFVSPVPNDTAASAGLWLLENSPDFSAATAVAAVFSEFQWPPHYHSTAPLIRLRLTYMDCFQTPRFDKSTRLKALQSAAAYYVLYHTQLIWNASKSLEVEVEKLSSDLPLDLFVYRPCEEWAGDDVFEYLLHVEDRSELVTSARFLSHIAPYWFCGDSDVAIKFRPSRLQTLSELIEVLEKSRALTPATIADCILCAGAVVDFPLHPEDLIRVDKSDYFVQIFNLVVEHIHRIVLTKGRWHRYAKMALEIILTLVKKTSFPLVEAAWINGLLKKAAWGNIDDETFVVLLRISALRKEEDPAVESEVTPGKNTHLVTPANSTEEYAILPQALRNVRICGLQEGGWQDDAVYGGLIAIGDIPGLRFHPPTDEFLQTLSTAMEKWEDGETKGGNMEKPFRVRKAAYDVVLAARDGWLNSVDVRDTLERLNFPKKLHSVVTETFRSDHQRSFLEMMEILSRDKFWRPYLREAMEIWLPLHREGPAHALGILTNVGELLLPASHGYNVEKYLEKVLEEEWAAVPGRLPMDLVAERLEPLAKVTERSKELLFTENERRAVLAVVEEVIPALEKRRDDNYGGPGQDIHNIIDVLLKKLREPVRATYHW